MLKLYNSSLELPTIIHVLLSHLPSYRLHLDEFSVLWTKDSNHTPPPQNYVTVAQIEPFIWGTESKRNNFR